MINAEEFIEKAAARRRQGATEQQWEYATLLGEGIMIIKQLQAAEPDIERLSEAVHKSYCEQYKKNHGKEYWTKGNYSLLDEETKEFDRATVRAVLQTLKGKKYE